jgi:hypothetical protein
MAIELKSKFNGYEKGGLMYLPFWGHASRMPFSFSQGISRNGIGGHD